MSLEPPVPEGLVLVPELLPLPVVSLSPVPVGVLELLLGLPLGSAGLPVEVPLGLVGVPVVALDPEPPVPVVVSVLPEDDVPVGELPVDDDPVPTPELPAPEVCAAAASGKLPAAARHPTITILFSHRVVMDVSLVLSAFP